MSCVRLREPLVLDLVLEGQLLGLRFNVLLVEEVLERLLAELHSFFDELGEFDWQVELNTFQAAVVLFLEAIGHHDGV